MQDGRGTKNSDQASGVLGQGILRALGASNAFDVTVLSRPDSQSEFPPDTKVVKIAYDYPNLVEVFRNQDAVICATGLSAIAHQTVIIDACIEAGVSRYITNDFGNPHDFTGLPELEFARKPKLEILEYVKQKAAQHKNFMWTALATGHFLDYAIKKFPAFGFNIAEKTSRLVDDGVEPFSSTTVDDIGKAVVGILEHPSETANQYLLVRTLETTQNDILKSLIDQTGGADWKIEHITAGELYEKGKIGLSKGDRGAILDLLPAQIFTRGAGRSTLPKERYDNELLGVREQNVDEVIGKILASLRAESGGD